MKSTQTYRTKNSYRFAYSGLINFLLHTKNSYEFYEVPYIKGETLVKIIKDILYVFSYHYNYAVDNALMVPVTYWEKGLVLPFNIIKSS